MVRIKICGLKRLEDIDCVNRTKPDYAGFVFAGIKRKIDFNAAAVLKNSLSGEIQSVGVFVNEPIENIVNLCNDKIIDIAQLHGAEDAEYIKELKSKIDNPVIKAVAVGADFCFSDFSVSCGADFVLFDGERGGGGKVFDWNLIKDFKETPYFLAGGLNKDNVVNALSALRPYCIDLNSGVESGGVKDFDKIKEIIEIVRGIR
ncbi:MAG: phosphoribosylanthranilate isomerase [Endomicrobium sp.]|jgi:phosphoribosylanthranilate isomerase|nr:phosphoribosylanthranilate isomerase [Endomicrobium sp.]